MKKTIIQLFLILFFLVPTVTQAAQIVIYGKCLEPTTDNTVCPNNRFDADTNLIRDQIKAYPMAGNSVKMEVFYDNISANKKAEDYLTNELRQICPKLPITAINGKIFCSDQDIKPTLEQLFNPPKTPATNPVVNPETKTPATTETDKNSTTTTTNNTSSTQTVDNNINLPNYMNGINLNIPVDDEDADLMHLVGPLLVRVINIFLTLAGIFATLMIIINGYSMIVAGGNQEQIKKAQTGLTYSVLGLIIILTASLLIGSVIDILGLDLNNAIK